MKPTDDQLLFLRGLLTYYENEMKEAAAKYHQAQPMVEHLKGVLAGLTGEPASDESVYLPNSFSFADKSAALYSGGVLVTQPFYGGSVAMEADSRQSAEPKEEPASQASAMPQRRPAFIDRTVMESVRLVLEKRGGMPTHADSITRDIFDVKTARQLQAGKRSVVSEIVRGMKKGLFRRVRKNTFVNIQRIENAKMAS